MHNLAIMYILIILFCITLSQKVPNIAQTWPLLYVGIFFIFIWTCYICLKICARKEIVFSGFSSSILYFILLFTISVDVMFNLQSRNAFILNLILGHIFPIVFVISFMNKSLNSMLYIAAEVLFSFSVFHALVAWFFIAGWSFSLLGIEYRHNWLWGTRLHGIMGEPTHFGLLMGLGLLSLVYLYKRRLSLYLVSLRVNIFYVLLSLFFISSIQFSGTRNALVATTLSLLVYSVFDEAVRKLLKKYVLFFIPIVLFSFIIFHDVFIAYFDILAKNLRIGDSTSENDRLLRISSNLSYISGFDILELLFGVGYSKSLLLTTSFNQYVDVLRDFGLIWLVMGMVLILFVSYTYFVKIRGGWSEGVYPFSLLVYSLSVFMFYSPMNSVFHIVSFVFVWSVLISFVVQKKVLIFTKS